MPVVRKVVDAIKLLSDGIKALETIVTACKDGQKNLNSRHPDAVADLSAM